MSRGFVGFGRRNARNVEDMLRNISGVSIDDLDLDAEFFDEIEDYEEFDHNTPRHFYHNDWD